MMKRIYLLILVTLFVTLGACSKKEADREEDKAILTPTPEPIATLPAQEVTDSQADTGKSKLADYFPIQADTEYVYEGKGNEFASYTRYYDYIDTENSRVQTRTDNGGTETVRVIELKEGKLSIIYKADECYYRDSFMLKEADPKTAEVLLMEPLAIGTQWILPDGRKRYISALETAIDTPSGKYSALEVTTEEKDGMTKDYYAPQAGLVKSIYSSGGLEVTSGLSEIKRDVPFTRSIDIYYPDSDYKLHVRQLALTFKTGDVTEKVLEEALKKEAAKGIYRALVSTNAKINSLYLGEDNIVYVDFSYDLVKDMNAGSGFEAAILQGITNTLGNYYGVGKVCITIDGKPYESGHYLMKEGDTFQVNMDEVVK